MSDAAWIVVGCAVFVVGVLVVRRLRLAARARARLGARDERLPAEPPRSEVEAEAGPLGRRLYRAGIRRRGAVASFWFWTAVCAAAGVAVVALLDVQGVFAAIDRGLAAAPGDLGAGFAPLLYIAPWLLIVMCACLPWLRVARRRRAVVVAVQRDLPNALKLLASLAQAGLGFDAAVARLLPVLEDDHPLAREFRTFRAETLSGRGRVACLRRFAWRLDVPQTTRFASALVQAEQLGSGLSESLRHQARDLRNDLRERALRRAQALPGKLVFPLVICFLPAVFAVSLAPALAVFLDEVTVPATAVATPDGSAPTPTAEVRDRAADAGGRRLR